MPVTSRIAPGESKARYGQPGFTGLAVGHLAFGRGLKFQKRLIESLPAAPAAYPRSQPLRRFCLIWAIGFPGHR
jgi:hypothetical protein